jgi:hypothetical protein
MEWVQGKEINHMCIAEYQASEGLENWSDLVEFWECWGSLVTCMEQSIHFLHVSIQNPFWCISATCLLFTLNEWYAFSCWYKVSFWSLPLLFILWYQSSWLVASIDVQPSWGYKLSVSQSSWANWWNFFYLCHNAIIQREAPFHCLWCMNCILLVNHLASLHRIVFTESQGVMLKRFTSQICYCFPLLLIWLNIDMMQDQNRCRMWVGILSNWSMKWLKLYLSNPDWNPF